MSLWISIFRFFRYISRRGIAGSEKHLNKDSSLNNRKSKKKMYLFIDPLVTGHSLLHFQVKWLEGFERDSEKSLLGEKILNSSFLYTLDR